MYRDSKIMTFSQFCSLFSIKCALSCPLSQSALPGALPFSFSSWNTDTPFLIGLKIYYTGVSYIENIMKLFRYHLSTTLDRVKIRPLNWDMVIEGLNKCMRPFILFL